MPKRKKKARKNESSTSAPSTPAMKMSKKQKLKKNKPNGSSSAAKAKTTPPAQRIIGPMFDKKDLHCTVCLDFPEKEIFQCENGHLMCGTCHNRVIQGSNPFCPNCRVRLSRERLYRNRFAEAVLSSLMVPCKNKGCKEIVQYGNLKSHHLRCGFRKLRCKYHPLGCSWEGIFNNLKAHQKNCPLKKARARDILKNVISRSKQEESKHVMEHSKLLAQKSVCELLSSHCGNICIRDVVIEKDDICDGDHFIACSL
eukprot:jgi/Bigna1/126423/aug1.2_g1131